MRRSFPLWPLGLLLVLSAAYWNVWMWSDSRLVLGVPVNLLYHLGLCVATAIIMAGVLRQAWPPDADED